MTSNRIQKLLFSEYSDFEDIVLVEGPFAETDRQGTGIRQVQVGLTPTKLIVASYFVEPVMVEELGHQWRPRRGQDPDIESFELISAYPVESVNLSVYRHHRRQTLKAHFCNGKVMYYEIGGWQERKMLWSVWCERIKFLSPYETSSSVSETSVGSSSSGGSSSLYIVHSSLSVTQAGKPTLWCHYARAETCAQGSWLDPHLYLGPEFKEKGINSSSLRAGDMRKTLSSTKKVVLKKEATRHSKNTLILSTELEMLAAEAVELWEHGRSSGRRRVRRKYAFSACPYLLGGLGIWRFSRPVAFSLQRKRSVSSVDLREDDEFKPPLPKGRLLRTVSLESLAVPVRSQENLYQATIRTRQRPLEFWTRRPEELLEWALPQYKSQQRYLRAVRKRSDPHIFGIKEKRKYSKRHNRCKTGQNLWMRDKKYSVSGNRGSAGDGGGGGDSCSPHPPLTTLYSNNKVPDDEGWLLPVSGFRASTLAHQLTMIHKHLFLQLTTFELSRARADMASWRAPALRALVFFSHRISCLVANHVLLEHEIRRRARVIVKFISVAYKAHRLHNQLSAESLLRGLHCLPVYRLHHTWARVRKYHANKYRRFEDLSRRYFDCREPLYQKTYDDMIRVPPFLPSVSLLITILLGNLPDLPQIQSFMFTTDCSDSCHKGKCSPKNNKARSIIAPTSLRTFLSCLQLRPNPPSHSPSKPSSSSQSKSSQQLSTCQSESHLHSVSRETLLEQLEKFFAPVSDASAHRILQDLEYFLESHLAAASRYQIPINPQARAFLLHSRHPNMRSLYRQSMLTEP